MNEVRLFQNSQKWTSIRESLSERSNCDLIFRCRDGEVNVGLNLDPGVTFGGVVLDEGGMPVRGARVNVRGRPDGAAKDVSRSVTVNSRGGFLLTGFAPGVYRVTVWRRGYRTQRLNDQRRSERELRMVLPKR